MSDFRVDVDLGRVPRLVDWLLSSRGLKAGLREAAIYFKGRADDYPPQVRLSRASVYGVTFFSDTQRRAFFGMLRSGDISVPYRRRGSGGLAGKFGIEERDSGFAQVIGNNATYARYLLDEERRTKMHASIGWKTLEEVYRAEESAIQRIVQNAIQRAIRDV